MAADTSCLTVPSRGHRRPAGFRLTAVLAALTHLRIGAGVLVLLLLGGCASVSTFRGIPLGGDSLYVSGVPPLRQDAQYACGPASVAPVGVHWGVSIEEFKTRCPAARQDATGPDLRAIAESLGLQAFVFQGKLDDLRDNLRRGRPMIVMITKPPDPALRGVGLLGGLALAISERVAHPPHWVVVVGLLGDREIIVHDPASGPLQIKLAVFHEWWAKQGNLCVLIARK